MSNLKKVISSKKAESILKFSRLRKVAGMITLYHGTTVEDFKKIVADGKFVPNKGENGATQNIENESDMLDTIGFTYFANSWYLAESYAELASDNGMSSSSNPDTEIGVIITLELSEELLLADTWNSPDSQTWQDSWESTGQVKVEGEVSLDNVTEVELLDPQTFESIYKGPLEGWQSEYEKLKSELTFANS